MFTNIVNGYKIHQAFIERNYWIKTIKHSNTISVICENQCHLQVVKINDTKFSGFVVGLLMIKIQALDI